jgi:hypothetical protein
MKFSEMEINILNNEKLSWQDKAIAIFLLMNKRVLDFPIDAVIFYAKMAGKNESFDTIKNSIENIKRNNVLTILSDDNNWGYVYLIGIENSNLTKIGTARNIYKRFWNYPSHSPFDIDIKSVFYVMDNKKVERELHKEYKSKLIKNEWFDLTKEDIKNINSRFNKEETLWKK